MSANPREILLKALDPRDSVAARVDQPQGLPLDLGGWCRAPV